MAKWDEFGRERSKKPTCPMNPHSEAGELFKRRRFCRRVCVQAGDLFRFVRE